MNPVVKRRIEQIRQRWWVVVLIAGAAILTAVPALLLAKPTYVGTSTLVLSSPGRNPIDDATMAVGYASLFNEPEMVTRLRANRNIPEDVTFAGRTVAASPILVVEATAADPQVAQRTAANMAEAFRDDINSVRKTGYDKAIKSTQKQLDVLLAKPGPDGMINPLAPVVQQKLDSLRSDSTNQLQDLQLQAGVTMIAPNAMFEIALRAVGGLLLGVLAAIGLSAMSTRLTNSADLTAKTGMQPLAEVPDGGSIELNRLREDRLRTLANIVSLQDLSKSMVIALTDTRGARGARDLAEALARLSAQQGHRTVLVYADNDASQHAHGAGFNDALVNSALTNNMLKVGAVDSLMIMGAGPVVADRYSLMSRDRISAVFDELRADADTIVVAAPSIAETIDAQSICAVADFTMVVVGRQSSRVADVTSAVDVLSDARASLLGVVLVDGRERTASGRLFWRRVADGKAVDSTGENRAAMITWRSE